MFIQNLTETRLNLQMINTENLKNPKIRVLWEDIPENFTQEKIARIKSYFSKKYNSRNINVITRSVSSKDDKTLSAIDVSENILDFEYQKTLMKDYIEQNEIDVDIDFISRLDDKVNNEIDKNQQNTIRYRQWKINRLEFSNFLSYGKGNVIDFDKLGGITCIESDPKNFGGKTVLSVDLLLFLFFNKTTKSSKNEEVFNRYTKDNEVFVRGDITIDGEDYIIVRKITRKLKRNKKDYTVSASLDFLKKNPDGTMENLSGEQRRETEEFIQSAIGDEQDFLTTILTTGNNLEELIDAKPTALGNIFTKFIGLEALRDKEVIAKKMFSDWSKKLLSNVYNLQDLADENQESQEKIDTNKELIEVTNKDIDDAQIDLEILIEKKDKLIEEKFTDIDDEINKLNPDRHRKSIEEKKQLIDQTKLKSDSIDITEPEEYYDEDKHDELKSNISKKENDITNTEREIKRIDKLITQLKEGEICPTCKRPLDEVDHSDEIVENENKVEKLKVELKTYNEDLEELKSGLSRFDKLRIQFNEYERNKLKKEKASLELRQHNMDLAEMVSLMDKWESNKTKLEKNADIEQKLLSTKTRIQTKAAEIDRFKEKLSNLKNEIANLEQLIIDNKEKMEKIEKENDYKKVFEIYLSIFGKNGITKVILRSMIPAINDELSRILSDSTTFTLDIRISEKNEVEFIMIDNETRIEKPLSTGSGFERTISSMALRSVLSKISALPKPNVIVMDEVLGKVADENLELVGEFFKKIKTYFEHIFLITHNDLVKNWSDNVICVSKENNVSKIKDIM